MSESRNPLIAKALAALHEQMGHTAAENPQQAHATHLAYLDPEQVSKNFYQLLDNRDMLGYVTFAYFAAFFADKPTQKTTFVSEAAPASAASAAAPAKHQPLTVAIPADAAADDDITVEPIADNATNAVAQSAKASGADDPKTPPTVATAVSDDDINSLQIMNHLCDLIGYKKFVLADEAGLALEQFIELLEATPNPEINKVLHKIHIKEKSIQISDDIKKSLTELLNKVLAVARLKIAPIKPQPKHFLFNLNEKVEPESDLKNDKANPPLIFKRVKELLGFKPYPEDENDAAAILQILFEQDTFINNSEIKDLFEKISVYNCDMKTVRVSAQTLWIIENAYNQAITQLPPERKEKTSDIACSAAAQTETEASETTEVFTPDFSPEQLKKQSILNETRNSVATALTGISYDDFNKTPQDEQKANHVLVIHRIDTALHSQLLRLIEAILTKRQYQVLDLENKFHHIFATLSQLFKARQDEIEAKEKQLKSLQKQIDDHDDEIEQLKRDIAQCKSKHIEILKSFINDLGQRSLLPRQLALEILDVIHHFYLVTFTKEAAPVYFTGHQKSINVPSPKSQAKNSAAAAAMTAADEAEEKAQRARRAPVLGQRKQKLPDATGAGMRFHFPRVSAAPEVKNEDSGRSVAYLMSAEKSGTVTAASAAKAAGVIVATTMSTSVVQTNAGAQPASIPALTATKAPSMSARVDVTAAASAPMISTAATNTLQSTTVSRPNLFALLRKEIEEFKRDKLHHIKPKLSRAATAPVNVESLVDELGLNAQPQSGALNFSAIPSVPQPTIKVVSEMKAEASAVAFTTAAPLTATLSAHNASATATNTVLAAPVLTAPSTNLMALTGAVTKEQALEKKVEAPALNISATASATDASLTATTSAHSGLGTYKSSATPDATVMAASESTDRKTDKPQTAAGVLVNPVKDEKYERLLGEVNFLQADIDELIKRAQAITGPHIDSEMMSFEYNLEDLEKIIADAILQAENQIRPFCEKFAKATHTNKIVLPVKLPLTGSSQEKLEAIAKIHNYLIEELEKFYKKRQLRDAKLHAALDETLSGFETDLLQQLNALQTEEALTQPYLATALSEFETDTQSRNQKLFDDKLSEFKKYLIQYYNKYYKSDERKRLIDQLDQNLKLPDKKLVIQQLIKAIRENKVHIQALQKELAARNIVVDLVTAINLCLTATRDKIPAVRKALDSHPKNPTPANVISLVASLKNAIRVHLDNMLLAWPDNEILRYRHAVQLMHMIRHIYAEKVKNPADDINKFISDLKRLKNTFISAIHAFLNNANLEEKIIEKQKVDLEKHLPSASINARMKKGLISALKFYTDAYATAYGTRSQIPTKLASLLQRAQQLNQKNTNDLEERAKFESKFNAIIKEFIAILHQMITAIDVTPEGKLHIKYHTHPTVAEELAKAASKDLNYMSKDIIDLSLQLLNEPQLKMKSAEVLRNNVISNLRYVLALDLRKEANRAILFKLYSDIQTEPACWFNKNLSPVNTATMAAASAPPVPRHHAILHRAVTTIVTKRDADSAAATAISTVVPARSPTH